MSFRGNQRGGEGNTFLPAQPEKASGKQDLQYKHWCFTLFYQSDDEIEVLKGILSDKCEKAYAGYEVCPTTKNNHLQGFFSWKGKNGARFSQLKKILGDRISLRKCDGGLDANLKYCSKEGQPAFSFGMPKPQPPLREITVYEPWAQWQHELVAYIATEPDCRQILWVWSEKGGIGKSQFVRYLLHRGDCLKIDRQSVADTACALALLEDDVRRLRALMIDIPRGSANVVPPTTNWEMLEELKTGTIFSKKYKSGCLLLPFMHVIVFANRPPDLNEDILSPDRLVVKNVD